MNSPGEDPSLVVLYQDNNNYYLVYPRANNLQIIERVGGVYYLRAVGLISTQVTPGTWDTLRVNMEGDSIAAFWNDQYIVGWRDAANPLLTGRFGFRQGWGRNVRWDDLSTTAVPSGGSLPVVAAYDDYYPFGMQMEGRSERVGDPQDRYKFTGKERDKETGYDYFGARYYDARIARWLSVDPLADKGPSFSPYNYSFNNPLGFVDPDGNWPMGPVSFDNWLGDLAQAAKFIISFSDVNDATVLSTWLTRGDNAINFDGSPATTSDKVAAIGGAVISGVSGSAVKKGVDAVAEIGSSLLKGRHGGVLHRAKIGEEAAKLKAEGYEITGGGQTGLKEEYLKGSQKGSTKGSNYVDITAEKDGKTVRIQVGKQSKRGLPVARERRKLEEIREKKPEDELRFVPYNEQ